MTEKEALDCLDDYYREELERKKAIITKNKELLLSIGGYQDAVLSDFEELLDFVNVTGFICAVEKPLGERQNEEYGIFKDVHVEQWSDGTEDGYYGNIYTIVGNTWYRIPYAC